MNNFPDLMVCCTSRCDDGIFECMVEDPSSSRCPFLVQFGDLLFCNHPDNNEFCRIEDESFAHEDKS